MTVKRVLIGCLIAAAFWTAGLCRFASLVNRPPRDTDTKTDAIVALTGGTERVAAAVDLLKRGAADKLLISGVNRKVDWLKLAETIDDLPENLGEKITLGHVACNTRENALESKEWLNRNGFKSVRLVTASYHMPRSLSEFRNVLDGVEIIPHPVFSPDGQTRRMVEMAGNVRPDHVGIHEIPDRRVQPRDAFFKNFTQL